MLHFETIWNEAESVSKSFSDLNRRDILGKIRTAVDNLSDSDTLPEYNEALGDILFGLCALCAHLEDKKDLQLNSAAALMHAIERARISISKSNDDVLKNLMIEGQRRELRK